MEIRRRVENHVALTAGVLLGVLFLVMGLREMAGIVLLGGLALEVVK